MSGAQLFQQEVSVITALHETSGSSAKIMKVCLQYLSQLNAVEMNVIKNNLKAQLSQGLLQFDIRIAGHECTAMVDSGSSRDIIDASLRKQLNLVTRDIHKFKLHMADDTLIICQSIAPKTAIKFMAVGKPPFKDVVDLSVVDLNGKFDIILGMPFLMRRNPQIDWRRRSMTFNNVHTAVDRAAAKGRRQITSVR